MKADTTETFIEKARAKHGDRYDYSKVIYVRSKEKVIIDCGHHGIFEQTPSHHINGQGCPKCGIISVANRSKSSTIEFTKKALAKHGDRYDYGKVTYTHSKKKVTITCRAHGDFKQTPHKHLMGDGCAKCSGTHSYSTLEWIDEAKKIHGNRYGYSKAIYVRAKDKITITCGLHGDFEQTPDSHLSNQGCAKCASTYSYTTPEWVVEAEKVHGYRYDYSEVNYVRSHHKVTIKCNEHGAFEQSPAKHLTGQGCPSCLWGRDQPTKIYLMAMGMQVKVGVSIDPEMRLQKLNRNNPEIARIISTWLISDFPTARAIEQHIHRKLKDYHAGLTGFDGATEWFNTTPCHAEWVINKHAQL